MATKVTIQNGQFQDATGNLVTGTLQLQLSQDAIVSGTGTIVPGTPISITVTSGNAAATQIWGVDNLTPSGLVYIANLFDSSGARVFGPENWSISGAGPIELNTLVPASSNASYPGAVLKTPSGDQTIVTNNLLPAAGNTTQSLGSTAAPWVGEFYSVNNIVKADAFAGADAGAKIAAAITALPSTGGIVDARGFQGAQTISSNLTIGTSSKPVIVLTGAATFTCSGTITLGRSSGIIGPNRDMTVMIFNAPNEGIITAAAAFSHNVTLQNLDIRTTGTGLTSASNALLHFKDSGRGTIKNVILSFEATVAAAAIRFEAVTAGTGVGTWQWTIENLTIQRTTANQGTASTTGQIGLDMVGLSSVAEGDVSMFNITNLWIENQTIGVQQVYATNNRFFGGFLLLNGTNLVHGSSSTSGCTDNLYVMRLDQYTTQHFSLDSHSADNVFFGKLEGGTSYTDNGTRNTRFNSIGGTGNLWEVGAGNELSIVDGGGGMALRLRSSNDSTGFAGIGFRNLANSSTNAQVYFQASDNSFHIYHNGSDRIVIPSGGNPKVTGALTIAGATPTGSGTDLGLGVTTGFGNGAAGTAVTTTLKSTGSGPTTPQTIVKYIQIDIGGTKYWIPLVQ